MNPKATVKTKGQLTIPAGVRKDLGLKPGDQLEFEKNSENGYSVRPVRKENPFAKFRGIERKGRGSSLDEVVKEIREMRGFDPDDPTVE